MAMILFPAHFLSVSAACTRMVEFAFPAAFALAGGASKRTIRTAGRCVNTLFVLARFADRRRELRARA